MTTPLPTSTVTLLMTDMEGSTQLVQTLGQQYAQTLLDHGQLLREAFTTFNGHIIDSQGDAYCVAFARATDGVAAAVAVQRALEQHPWPGDQPVRLRIGLHTGEPTLLGDRYVGIDLHRTARIRDAGHGGQILLSQVTLALVETSLPDGVTARDLGEHWLKDLRRPRRLFQLVIEGLPSDFPPLRTRGDFASHLPTAPTGLVNRERERAAMARLLERPDVRIVTLTGPGGVGKTRLALHMAEEAHGLFADGVYWVNLAAVTDPALVIAEIAQTLGLRELSQQGLADALQVSLRDKRLLLVLDNFEQVTAASPAIATLLTACPHLKALVTSREPLRVRGEHQVPVAPLAVPPDVDGRQSTADSRASDASYLSQYAAVALFIQRATAVKPDFVVTNANAPAVAEICARLEGLPLAIELAAARVKVMPPQALLARLVGTYGHTPLQLLTGGARDLAPRHQTLRAAIEWSNNLLDAAEKTLFQRLAVFAGGFTFEAAEAVVSQSQTPQVDIFEGITSLVDRSLLRQSEADDEPRFSMLETVREYAIEQLALAGQAVAMQRRHAEYYLALVEATAPGLQGANQALAYARLEREYGNIRAALRWSQQENEERATSNEAPPIGSIPRSSLLTPRFSIGLRLLNALHLFVTQRGHFQEARAWIETLLTQATDDRDPTLWGRALSTAGSLAISQGDLEAAQRWLQAAIASARQTGDRLGLAYALMRLGDAAMPLGQHQAARQYHTESVDLFRQLGDGWGLARALNDLGDVLFRQGDRAAAADALAESNALFQQLGDTWMRALTLSNWALVALADANTPLAETRLQEAVQIARASGNRWRLGYGLVVLGEVARAQGDMDRAEAYYTESLGIYRDLGHPGNIVVSTINLAYVKQHRGEYAAADALLRDSLALAQTQGNRRGMTECLAAMIGVAQGQGQATRAAQLLGAVEAVREALGALASPVDRARYDQYASELRATLGDAAYQTAWTAGRTLTLDQAMAYALTEK